MENKKVYEELLKSVESLQSKLMGIENYDEEVYQSLQSVEWTLVDVISEES